MWKWLEKWAKERNDLLMKQAYGDKPGEHRPQTEEEIRKYCERARPNIDEEGIQALIDQEAFNWDEEKLLP